MKLVGMYGDIYRYFCVFIFGPDLDLKVFFTVTENNKTVLVCIGLNV